MAEPFRLRSPRFVVQARWSEPEDTFRNILATLQESTYEQESESDVDTSSENNSGKGQGEDNEEDEDEDLDCGISDVLQELAYVLAQQGKEEETTAIKEELAIEEAAGRWPPPWEDID